MVDLREFRGIAPVKNKNVVPTDSVGFVDVRSKVMAPTLKATATGLFYGKSVVGNSQTNFSTEKDGYDKREVDAKMTELDNKIYRLEQRIELLERKLGVNQSTANPLMNWG